MSKQIRKRISLLLIFSLLTLQFLQFDLNLNKVYAYDNSDVVVTAETFEQGQDIAELVANLEPRVGANESYYYYYNQLTDVEKAIYQCMEKATLDNPLIVLKGMEQYTDEEVGNIALRCLNAYVCDQPLARLYWKQYVLNTYRSSTGDVVIEMMRESISSDYLVDKALDRIDAIVDAVPKGKDRYTTLMNLSLYIAGTTEYDDYEDMAAIDLDVEIVNAICQSPTGLFCYGVDVCMGYAYSCKLLCDKLGIPCVIILSSSHAWNYIQMEDQKWYSIDWTYSSRFFDDMESFNSTWKDYIIKKSLIGADDYSYVNDWRYESESTLEVGNIPELSRENYSYTGKYDYEFGVVSEYNEPDTRFVYTPNEDGVSCTITGYEGVQQGDLVIPSIIDGLSVTAIGAGAFYRCNGFDGKVIIPDSVTEIGEAAFSNCRNITGIEFSANLKSIGKVAFGGCIGLQGDLILPNSLETIGRGAFIWLKCNGFLYIPTKVSKKELDDAIYQFTPFSGYVLYDDNTDYVVDNGILYSSDYSTLVMVPRNYEGVLEINKSVTTIGKSACERCEHITDIVWPNDLKVVEKWAFRYCNGMLGDLILPDTIEIIEDGAFAKDYTIWQNYKLGTLHLPEKLRVLGDYAFSCGAFTGEVVIPDSLEELSMGEEYSYDDNTKRERFDAFEFNYFDKIVFNCSNKVVWEMIRKCETDENRNVFEPVHHGETSTIRVPIDGVDNSYIEIITCDTCSEEIGRRSIIEGNEAEVIVLGDSSYGYLSTDNTLYVIGEGDLYGYNYPLDDYAKQQYEVGDPSYSISPLADKTIKKVVFGDGITTIGQYAFYKVSDLESVELSDTVTSIGYNAFAYCEKLESVVWSDNLETIGDNAFYVHHIKGELILPDSVESIGSFAFSTWDNYYNITSLHLPESVKTIGACAFYQAGFTSDLYLPDSLEVIDGFKAFYNNQIGKISYSCNNEVAKNWYETATDAMGNSYYGDSVVEIIHDWGDDDTHQCVNCGFIEDNKPLANTVTVDIEGWTYGEVAKVPTSTATYGTASYTYSDSENGIFSAEVPTIAGTWYVKATVEGTTDYEGGSAIKSFTIAKKELTITADSDEKAYDGTALTKDSYTATALAEGDVIESVVITGTQINVGNSANVPSAAVIKNGTVDVSENYEITYVDGMLTVVVDDNPAQEDAFVIEDGVLIKYNGTDTEVVIPDGVTSIGDKAFYDCSNLIGVTIPNSVISIGDNAFRYCISLKSINIPDGVTSIGKGAFCSSGLTSVIIPNGLTHIETGLFDNCQSLRVIAIPESVTSIADYAIPSGQDIYVYGASDSYAEEYCKEHDNLIFVAWFVIEDGVLIEYNGIDSNVIIPDGIISIGDSAFDGNDRIISITIPEGVTSIGNAAFRGCSGLTDIIIPESVTSIGVSAFSDCSNLTSVMIPESVIDIGNYAFSDCSSLTNISVSDNNQAYKSIGGILYNKAQTELKACPGGLKGDLIIPEGITVIKPGAFYGCSELTNVIIPEGVTSIGVSAFSGCSSLTSIVIPQSVTNINPSTFYGCSVLVSVSIADGVTSIGYFAFMECSDLATITIPDSVTTIHRTAFDGCDSLTIKANPTSYARSYADEHEITFMCINHTWNEGEVTKEATAEEEGVKTYTCTECGDAYEESIEYSEVNNGIKIGDNVYATVEDTTLFVTGSGDIYDYEANQSPFYDDTTITSIVFSDGIIRVGNYAFQDMHKVTSITFSDSIESIGQVAFSATLCTNLILPKNLKELDQEAFGWSSRIRGVVLPEGIETINTPFSACTRLRKIYVPNSVIQIELAQIIDCVIYGYTGVVSDYASEAGMNFVNLDEYEYFGLDPWTVLSGYEKNQDVEPGRYGTDNFFELIGSIKRASSDHYSYQLYADGAGKLQFTLDRKGTLRLNVVSVGKDKTSYYVLKDAEGNTVDDIRSVDGTEDSGSLYENLMPGTYTLEACRYEAEDGTVTNSAIRILDASVYVILCNEHQWDDGEVTVAPTHDHVGTMRYTCEICGYSYEKEIEKLVQTSQDDVQVEYFDEDIDEDVKLVTEEVTDASENYEEVINIVGEIISDTQASQEEPGEAVAINYIIYNIKLLDESGEEVQPNGKIKVRIPVPEGFNPETSKVYRIEANNTLTDLKSLYKDGYLEFETEHFSLYIVADNELKQENAYTPGDINNDGAVNNKDVTRLRQYLAGWSVEVNEAALDVNGDGSVNNKDVTRLRQYLAGWEVSIY